MAIRDRALFLLLSPPSLAAAHLTGEVVTPHKPFFRIRTRRRWIEIHLTQIPTSFSRERGKARKESKRYERNYVS